MKYAKAVIIFILFVPMMIFLGFAALFGAVIRALNIKEEPDEFDGPNVHPIKPKPQKDGHWMF